MPRLNHNTISAALAEDATCPGCDRDRLDCVCMGGDYEPVDLDWMDYADTRVEAPPGSYYEDESYGPDWEDEMRCRSIFFDYDEF